MNVWDVLTAAYTATPYIVALLTALVTLGFTQVAFLASGVVRYLTLGFLLLYLKVFLRTTYWDILPSWVPPDLWAAWLEASRGLTMNVVFHLMVIFACYFSLKAIHRAIPERERARFTFVTAPFYRLTRCRWAAGPRRGSGVSPAARRPHDGRRD